MNQKTTNNFNIINNLTKAIDFSSFDNINELLVIIPCYNEANNIERTVNDLLKQGDYHFLIIDDGSTDNIIELCEKYKWKYLKNEQNIGLSKSFRLGVEYAMKHNYRYVVEFDGDGQFNATDIAKLFFFAKKGYDIVTSSRFISDEVDAPKLKIKFMYKILNTCFFLKTHTHITDPMCGLRMYNWYAMQTFVQHPRLEVEIASLSYMVKHFKMKILEIPTYLYERTHKNTEIKMKASKKPSFLIKQLFKMIVS